VGAYAALQVFKPCNAVSAFAGGIVGTAGTPNLLLDLSYLVYQAQWTLNTQGGVSSGQFDCRNQYENVVDLLYGNYVLWGLYGAKLSAPAAAGASSVTVTGLTNQQYPAGWTFNDLIAGDVVMITDGTNTELFQIPVGGITGGGPWTINLVAPGSDTLQAPPWNLGGTLLNSYAAGAIIVRVQLQGYVSQRVRATSTDKQFSLNVTGFFARYNSDYGNANVSGKDGANWLYRTLQEGAGQPLLTADFGSGTTYSCTDGGSIAIGQQIRIGRYNNDDGLGAAELFTATGVVLGVPSVVTVNHAPAHLHKAKSIVFGTPSLPDIIIDDALLVKSSVPVNISATDTALSELIATVLRQETGSTPTETYAVWIDGLRQLHHQPIASVPYTEHETKMQTDAPAASTTFTPVSMTGCEIGMAVQLAGANGYDNLTVLSKTATTFTTVTASNFDHPAGSLVRFQWSVTPTFVMSQSDNGSAWGDVINKIQTTDMDGTGPLINAAIVSGTVEEQDGVEETTLTAHCPPGTQTFPVAEMIFQLGDQIVLSPDYPPATEYLTIDQAPVGNTFHTSAACTKDHLVNNIVREQSDNGPRILVFQPDSINNLGWYEGTLNSEDISNKAALAQWAAYQMMVSAWPVLSASIDLDIASCRITGQDLLEVNGFTDGSQLVVSVTQVQYQWVATQMNVTGSLQVGRLASGATAYIDALKNEGHAKQKKGNPKKKIRNKDGHMDGGAFTATGGNAFTIDACTVCYGGVVYQAPAYAGTAAEGETWLGVDLSNPAAPVIGPLPSQRWNGKTVYAESIWQVLADGSAPTEIAKFVGIPLWRLECKNQDLQGYHALTALNGVGLNNLPSATLPPSPTLQTAAPIPTSAALASGISSDVTAGFELNNVPLDNQTHSIKIWTRTTSTAAWSYYATQKIPGAPQPSALLNVSVVFNNMVSGTIIDIGCSYDALNGEGPIAAVITAYAIPGGGSLGGTKSFQAITNAATQLLAANSARVATIVRNTASAPLYLGVDNTVSPTNWIWEVAAGQSFPIPISYGGALWGTWQFATDPVAGAGANVLAVPS
jgi:hypothetical protein